MVSAISILGIILVVTTVSAFAFVMWFIGTIVRWFVGGIRLLLGFPSRPCRPMYMGQAGPVSQVICRNVQCSQQNPRGAAFCRRCGQPLGQQARSPFGPNNPFSKIYT
jgi:hypothetical protein